MADRDSGEKGEKERKNREVMIPEGERSGRMFFFLYVDSLESSRFLVICSSAWPSKCQLRQNEPLLSFSSSRDTVKLDWLVQASLATARGGGWRVVGVSFISFPSAPTVRTRRGITIQYI